MVSNDVVTELARSAVLPRLDAGATRALNRVYARARPLPLSVHGTGYEVLWRFDASPPPGAHAYRFRVGAHAGVVAFDAPTQALLLRERHAELLPVDLRYLLLADALAPLADQVEKALRLRFEWMPPEPAQAALPARTLHALHFRLASSGAAGTHGGWLQFDEPAALAELAAALPDMPAVRCRSLEGLRVPVSFCVGKTQIRLREVRSVEPGDIIGIEEWSSSGAALLVTAELGGPAGRTLVGLAEGSRITLHQVKDPAMTQELTADGAAQDEGQLPLDRLDALEVTLRFEVGELAVSLGELRSVRTGHVFELGQELNRSPVRILAHGNVLGKGYLVAVGDRLGVRVSEFAPSEL